jgi:hypothetical protein
MCRALYKLTLIESGGRRRIRTSDRSVRSRVLYPAELCAHSLLYKITIYKINGGEGGIRTLDRATNPILP